MDNVSLTTPARLETIKSLNNSEGKARLPAIVFQSIMIAIGISGNVMVWIIYGYKIKKQSTHKTLVLGIAFYDTLACCFGIPGNILDLGNPYTFYSSVGCKLLRFGYHIVAAGSSTVHLLMGIDRYRRICIPLGKQISNKRLIYLIVATFLLVIIVATPTLILYASVEVPTGVSGISGWQCGHHAKHSMRTLFYDIFLGTLVIVCGSCLIVLYALVGRTICKRGAIVNSMVGQSVRKKRVSETPLPIVDNLDRSDIDDNEEMPGEANKPDPNGKETDAECPNNDDIEGTFRENRTVQTDRDDVVEIVRQMQLRKTSLRNAKSRRLTLITFLLAMIFMLSYFPVFFLSCLAISRPDKIQQMTFDEKCTYYLFLVSYTINNVSNPLVYLSIDEEFRNKIKKSMSDIHSWCTQIYC